MLTNPWYHNNEPKKMVIFGTGSASFQVMNGLPRVADYFVDNDSSKWNQSFLQRPIHRPNQLLVEDKDKIMVVIASSYFLEIAEQLENMGFQEDIHFIDGISFVNSYTHLSMNRTLTRLKSLINVSTIIDVGASDGHWSLNTMRYFPECNYFLIEAKETHRKKLVENTQHKENMNFIISAAGDYTGEIYFRQTEDPFGGAASHVPSNEYDEKVPLTTIDDCVQSYQLSSPFLLKLDTHGFEVPILKGASQTLSMTELIIIEAYNFNINNGLKFHQLCAYMENLGFRCADLACPLHRPTDQLLWQMDLFFIKDSHPAFRSTTYL